MKDIVKYPCPYCGEQIRSDRVLFRLDDGKKYEDPDRYNFLSDCTNDWPFERNYKVEGSPAIFTGLYYLPGEYMPDYQPLDPDDLEDMDEDELEEQHIPYCRVIQQDMNGFPTKIAVDQGEKGLTPEEVPEVLKLIKSLPKAERAGHSPNAPHTVDMLRNRSTAEAYEPQSAQPAQPVQSNGWGAPTAGGWGAGAAGSGWGSSSGWGQPAAQASTPARRSTQSGEQLSAARRGHPGVKSLFERCCPHCHCMLDTAFGPVPTVSIVLVGGRAAGKTAYMMAMASQLQKQLSERNLGGVELLPDSKTYFDLLDDQARNDNGKHVATDRKRLFPLIFRYTNMMSKHLAPGKENGCYLAVYDAAGEGMFDPQYMESRVGMKTADTMLMILDPNMLVNGEFVNRQNVGADRMTGDHDFFGGSLDNFLSSCVQTMRTYNILPNVRSVVAITSKIDQPMMVYKSRFKAGQNELRYDLSEPIENAQHQKKIRHSDAYDWNIQRELEKSIRQFYLDDKSDPKHAVVKLEPMIRAAFKDSVTGKLPTKSELEITLMAVSTWTKVDSADIEFRDMYMQSGRGFRVIEPMLKVLASHGFIPQVNMNEEEAAIVKDRAAIETQIHVEEDRARQEKNEARRAAQAERERLAAEAAEKIRAEQSAANAIAKARAEQAAAEAAAEAAAKARAELEAAEAAAKARAEQIAAEAAGKAAESPVEAQNNADEQETVAIEETALVSDDVDTTETAPVKEEPKAEKPAAESMPALTLGQASAPKATGTVPENSKKRKGLFGWLRK